MKRMVAKLSSEFITTLVVVIGISVLASRFFVRLDFTEDAIYTLTDGSRNIARDLKKDVEIKLYFSKTAKELPPAFKAYGGRIQEVLNEYANYSDNKITVETIDPKPDSEEEVWARKYGIQGIQLPSGDEAYLGAVFLAGSKEATIPYIDPRREEFLEYDISEALVKLEQETKPKLAIYSSLPISQQSPGGDFGQTSQEWAFVTALRDFFEVIVIDDQPTNIAQDVNIFILMHPKQLSESFEFAIDQFVMRGGRLLLMLDSFSRTDLASNSQNAMLNNGQLPTAKSKLDRLLNHWGLTFHSEVMVGDPMRSTRISTVGQPIDYPYFLSLTQEELNKEQTITANLKQILLAESGHFTFEKPAFELEFEPLIQTTESSGSASTNMAAYLSPIDLAKQLSKDRDQKALAGVVKGKFTSAYSKVPEGVENKEEFISKSETENAVVVIGDIDFISDNNAVERLRFLNQIVVRPRNDNLNLVLNTAEFLGGNPDLISIRSSGRIQRPFTKVRELQIAAGEKWKAEEERLSNQINELQSKLNELQSKRTDGNRTILTADQELEIKKFREQEADVRKRRRQVRKNLREEIEALGRQLIAINILIVPGLVSALGLLVFWRREKKSRGE